MTLDQKIQVWMVIGTWLAGIGTLAAVIIALHLARRSERIRLKVHVGHRVVVIGDGSPFQEHVSISVTNLGERRYCLQPVSGPFTTPYPMELTHGKCANFLVSFLATPNWLRDFATGFVRDLSDGSTRTLVAQIHTSVGKTVEVKPEADLIRRLRESAAATGS